MQQCPNSVLFLEHNLPLASLFSNFFLPPSFCSQDNLQVDHLLLVESSDPFTSSRPRTHCHLVTMMMGLVVIMGIKVLRQANTMRLRVACKAGLLSGTRRLVQTPVESHNTTVTRAFNNTNEINLSYISRNFFKKK
jgi:hypothetical protein